MSIMAVALVGNLAPIENVDANLSKSCTVIL